MMHRYHWRGRLHRNPYPEPVAADALLLPYRVSSDYQAIQTFARTDAATPVLLGNAQYYHLLASVVRALHDTLEPDGPILLEISRPLGVPLPRELLRDGVLICDEVDSQAAWWAQAGVDSFAVVRSRIRRDLHEFGDNTLTLSAHTRRRHNGPLATVMTRCGLVHAFTALPPCARAAHPTTAVPEHTA